MSPAEVQLIVALITAAPALATGILGALNPDARASVLAQLAAAQQMLPAAGSVQAEVERVIASHPRLSMDHALTAASIARSAVLTGHERTALKEIAQALEAGFATAETAKPARGHLAPVMRVVTDEPRAPKGTWGEPGEGD